MKITLISAGFIISLLATLYSFSGLIMVGSFGDTPDYPVDRFNYNVSFWSRMTSVTLAVTLCLGVLLIVSLLQRRRQRMKNRINALVAVTLLFGVGAQARTESCKGESLPREIQHYLQIQSNDWKLIEVSDLSTDDKADWLKENSGGCPGIVVGKFKPSAGTLYALALISKSLRPHVKLLVFEKQNNNYKSTVLLKPIDIGMVPVILKAPSGTAEEWDTRRKVKLRYPGIQLVCFESSSDIYYWSNGKFREIWTSD